MDNTPKIVGAGHSPEKYMRMQFKKHMDKMTGRRLSKQEMATRKLFRQSRGKMIRSMSNMYGNIYGNVQTANPKTWEDRNRANQGTKLNK